MVDNVLDSGKEEMPGDSIEIVLGNARNQICESLSQIERLRNKYYEIDSGSYRYEDWQSESSQILRIKIGEVRMNTLSGFHADAEGILKRLDLLMYDTDSILEGAKYQEKFTELVDELLQKPWFDNFEFAMSVYPEFTKLEESIIIVQTAISCKRKGLFPFYSINPKMLNGVEEDFHLMRHMMLMKVNSLPQMARWRGYAVCLSKVLHKSYPKQFPEEQINNEGLMLFLQALLLIFTEG